MQDKPNNKYHRQTKSCADAAHVLRIVITATRLNGTPFGKCPFLLYVFATLSLTDQGFLGGRAKPKKGIANPRFDYVLGKIHIKMKKLVPLGGGGCLLTVPPSPTWIRQCILPQKLSMGRQHFYYLLLQYMI